MTSPPSMASAVPPTGVTHTVTVGGAAGLVYTPSSINAAKGDMVEFQFQSINHTVTQSAFMTPCERLDGGMDTGFMPNPSNLAPPPAMAMMVTVDTPLCEFSPAVVPLGPSGEHRR